MSVRLLTVCCASVSFIFSATVHSLSTTITVEQQRQLYGDARKSLDQGDTVRYHQLKKQLADYPLLPYLEYQELSKQLKNYPYDRVDHFLETHDHSYLGNLLLRKWLSQLASSKRWHEYRSYFNKRLTSATHSCLFLWSRLQTGDKSALQEVEALWNVGRSQPDACNPLFKAWQKAGYLQQELVWERYIKASLKNKNSLTRYLKRLMSPQMQNAANEFHKALRNPSLLQNTAYYKNDSSHKKDIVFHGLYRHIRANPDQAWQLWQHYQQEYAFSEKQKTRFIYQLAKRHGYNGEEAKVKPHLSQLTQAQYIKVCEIVIRESLKESNWQAVDHWISLLPQSEQESERWQYWQARSYESLGKARENFLPIYSKLAENRNFYGFLSADYLGQNYSLRHTPTIVQQETRNRLESIPAMMRARELFYLNKLHDARQEWAYATVKAKQTLSPEAYQGAAQMAYEWGWHRKSIESMAAAAAWDDLSIRFPVAHESIIQQQAQQTNLPPTLLFAIARQESAWETDAKSRAGARGLMQLMPQTAKETARKAGITHRLEDLYEPEHNITLGSRYISELLAQYDNNRVPAIAAYNAGPHRVNQWLKRTASQLPYDVWIEVIPFGETRKYVQNVLSYALVYAYHTGNSPTLLSQLEINRPL